MRGPDSPLRLSSKPPLWLGVLFAVSVVAAGTLAAYPLKSAAPVVSLGVVFIPGVLLVSTVSGLRLGLFTALLSALAFNWFHIPPTGRLTISNEGDLIAFVVFAIAAVVSGTLADFARARVADAEEGRERADRALAEAAELARERDRMQAEAIEAEALRRSDELKTALLRAVSHDLRSPLTSMIAAGSALDSPSLTPEERNELSGAVVEEGQRLSRLVENLLDVSRLESGNAEPRREPIDLTGVLEAARESIGADPGQVRLPVDSEAPAFDADPVQLERVFANLIENGVRHSGGRPVLVRSRQTGGRLVVRVVDQGPGVPEQDRERIFEPFYRRADANQGFGLGLAIARGFVEANGGEIAVESVPGQGSTFVVSFPLAEDGK
jgi:two-component system, OmpR family, sensor histidine kinase KdpD